MTCTYCRGFGLVNISKDPDIDVPCECVAGEWMRPLAHIGNERDNT